MPVNMDLVAPKNMPEEPERGGMGPGIIEGVKSAIQWLLKQGMTIEQIMEAVLKLVGDAGLDISEEEARQLIQKTASEGGELPPTEGEGLERPLNKLRTMRASQSELGRIMEE